MELTTRAPTVSGHVWATEVMQIQELVELHAINAEDHVLQADMPYLVYRQFSTYMLV